MSVPADPCFVDVTPCEDDIVLEHVGLTTNFFARGHVVFPLDHAVFGDLPLTPEDLIEQLIVVELIRWERLLRLNKQSVAPREVGVFVDEKELQTRLRPDGIHGLVGVVSTRQLDVDSAAAHLDDRGLLYTGGVDALTKRLQHLLDRLVRDLFDTLFLNAEGMPLQTFRIA